MTDQLLLRLAESGLGWVVAILIGVSYVRKDKKVDEIQEKRTEDLKNISDKWASMVGETNKTLQSLTDAIKLYEKK